jgi:hypothetical protein
MHRPINIIRVPNLLKPQRLIQSFSLRRRNEKGSLSLLFSKVQTVLHQQSADPPALVRWIHAEDHEI